jgi:hypothetical protein
MDSISHQNLKAVLFKSQERFAAFKNKLEEYGVDVIILDFDSSKWLNFDYSEIDILIYYPSFKYSSNHPLSLFEVHDNITFLHKNWPHVRMFPSPNIIKYYNDKYRQYLFLQTHNYPIPETIPLYTEKSLGLAEEQIGYPMVIKNRYGAGGGSVFRIFDRKALEKYYKISTLDMFNCGFAKYLAQLISKRMFYYHLIKAKRMPYPFLSPPLLAQKYIKIDRDLKTVACCSKVVEAHWRVQADEDMWKMNIDGGGTGVWGKVDQEALDLSVRLAKDLKASWLNIDLMMSHGKFLISEFSPVWHHYAYNEKPSFEYRDDYNIEVPLEISLDLERIIVESLIDAVNKAEDRSSSLR